MVQARELREKRETECVKNGKTRTWKTRNGKRILTRFRYSNYYDLRDKRRRKAISRPLLPAGITNYPDETPRAVQIIR